MDQLSQVETIFVDGLKHCHRTNDGTMRSVETDFFVGRCDAVVEGHCYDDSNGYTVIYPWKRYSELSAAQREYERQKLAEYEVALANSIPVSDLNAAYLEGVNSI